MVIFRMTPHSAVEAKLPEARWNRGAAKAFHSFFALSFSTDGLYLSLAERQIFWTPLAPLSSLGSRILTLSNHGTGVARFDWNAVHVCFFVQQFADS